MQKYEIDRILCPFIPKNGHFGPNYPPFDPHCDPLGWGWNLKSNQKFVRRVTMLPQVGYLVFKVDLVPPFSQKVEKSWFFCIFQYISYTKALKIKHSVLSMCSASIQISKFGMKSSHSIQMNPWKFGEGGIFLTLNLFSSIARAWRASDRHVYHVSQCITHT